MKWADEHNLFLQINYSINPNEVLTRFDFYKSSLIADSNRFGTVILDEENRNIKEIIGLESFRRYIEDSLTP